ncbi:uncharacterized protein [Ptychodera flava]|uniref:uncharacterized protein n=1 Tax=Ptychodera flava TaxID=63121 RepID=UPI00396A3B36
MRSYFVSSHVAHATRMLSSDEVGVHDANNIDSVGQDMDIPEQAISASAGRGRTSECEDRDTEMTAPHVTFPTAPGCNWETKHTKRLGFKFVKMFKSTPAWMIDNNLPSTVIAWTDIIIHNVICKWLSSSVGDLTDMLSCLDGETFKEIFLTPGFTEAAIGKGIIPSLVSHKIPLTLGRDVDGFLSLVEQYCSQFNLKKDDSKVLMDGIYNFKKSKSQTNVHLSAVCSWVDACKGHAEGKLSETLLDDFLVGVIHSAAHESGCVVVVKVRESTACEINICGQIIKVESDIEVRSFNKGLLQVIASAESLPLSGRVQNNTETPRFISQLASKALAIGPRSPFGNSEYKTAYQLSIRALCSPSMDDSDNEVEIILVRSHISCETLRCMSKCPHENQLRPSFIIYEKIPCDNIYNPVTVSTIYRAIKAVFFLFENTW